MARAHTGSRRQKQAGAHGLHSRRCAHACASVQAGVGRRRILRTGRGAYGRRHPTTASTRLPPMSFTVSRPGMGLISASFLRFISVTSGSSIAAAALAAAARRWAAATMAVHTHTNTHIHTHMYVHTRKRCSRDEGSQACVHPHTPLPRRLHTHAGWRGWCNRRGGGGVHTGKTPAAHYPPPTHAPTRPRTLCVIRCGARRGSCGARAGPTRWGCRAHTRAGPGGRGAWRQGAHRRAHVTLRRGCWGRAGGQRPLGRRRCGGLQEARVERGAAPTPPK
jgi:hypothetical protein